MNIINAIEQEVVAKNEGKLDFSVGDTVKVYFKIVEGATERIQAFEGLVIAINNSGIRTTFVVRKISYGVGVERIFRPIVLWVTSLQLFAHLKIGIAPEAVHVLGQLHGLESRRQEFHKHGAFSSVDTGRVEHPEAFLQAYAQHRCFGGFAVVHTDSAA